MRVFLVVLVVVAGVSGARVADGADPALRQCRLSCKQAKGACMGQVKKELQTLLGACVGSSSGRRQCRQQAKGAARGARAACGSLKRDCRACCGGGGSDCAARCGDGAVTAARGEQCDPPGAACGTGGSCDARCHCPLGSTTTSTIASTTSTTVPGSPPSSPTIVFLAATATDTATLAWLPTVDDTTPAGAIRYEVHVAGQAGFDPTAATLRASMQFAAGDEPHADVGGLTPGATYHVLVVALDEAGLPSTARDYRSLTLPTLPVVLSATIPLQTAAGLGLGEPVVSGSTYTYTAGSGAVAPAVGAVLFGVSQGGGYLRRVASAASAAGQIVVETSDASLSDAVDQMALSSSHTLFDIGQAATTASLAGRARAETTSDARLRWGNELLVATETVPAQSVDGVVVAPGRRGGDFSLRIPRADTDVGVNSDVDFEPELRTHATWTTDLLDGVTLRSAEVVARGTLTMSVDAHYRFSAAGSVQRTIPFPVLTRTYTSVYVVGGVPVHQQITFTLNAQVSATASAAIDATASAGATALVEFGVRYNPTTESWDDVAVADFKPSITADLVVKGKVVGQVKLVPNIEVKFYDVVSAHLSVEPTARAQIETQATTSPACAPLELTKFDVGLVIEPFVSADFRALARNVSLFGKTRVGGPFTFALFELPSARVSSQDRGNGMVSVLAAVTDGVNDPFDPASARWDVSPETATITPATGSTLGVLTCQQMATYKVSFSGHGVLGEEGRRCTTIDVPCKPSTTTTTSSTLATSSTLTTSTSSSTSTTTTTSSTTTSTTTPNGGPCGTFLTKWGTSGVGQGQFIGPRGVAIDRRNGNVYVTDGGTNRVQKFDRNHAFLTQWGGFWGSGPGDGAFRGILGIAISDGGLVYVVDADGDRVQKFDANGTFLGKWGTEGTGDGQFDLPYAVAVDGFGNVYIVDRGNARVQKFDANGGFLTKWGRRGHLDGEFSTALGIATDAVGNVYVLDQVGVFDQSQSVFVHVQKFNAAGGFLAKWGMRGRGDGQFQGPVAIATDQSGNVFVSDPFRGDIQKFTGTGTFLAKWGSMGTGNGQFGWAIGLASDGNGNVYVADRDLRSVKKFSCP